MNKQEAFDRALAGLRAQGRPSLSDKQGPNLCAYRGVGGLKCAVGFLIPDEEYKPEWDNEDSFVHGDPLKDIASLLNLDTEFLANLQHELHDKYFEYSTFPQLESAAKQFAAQEGLTYSEPAA